MRKVFTLFIMCLFATAFAGAEEIVVTFSDLYGNGEENVQPATDVTSGPFSFSFAQGDANNAPGYFAGNYKEMRLYGGKASETPNGNTMTVTSTTNMTQIVLVHGSSTTWAELTADTGTITMANNHDATWTGSATSVTFTAKRGSSSSQYRFKSATITTGQGDEVVVAKPTFTPEPGTYYAPINVALKCGTAGASIYYTLDGTAPTTGSTLYSAPIAISSNTTIKALAALDNKVSEVAEAVYEFGESTPVANIAAYQAIDDSVIVKFSNPVTVTWAYNKHIYVKDETGYAYFWGTSGQNYKSGNVIPANFTGKKVTRADQPELEISATGGFAASTEDVTVEPEQIQCADVDASLFAHYVLIKGAKFGYTENNGNKNMSTITDASVSEPIVAYNQLGLNVTNFDYEKVYDVTAIIGSYKKEGEATVYQVYPVKVVDPNASQNAANIADYAALENNTIKAIDGDVTVYYVSGQNTFVMDDSGYLCIYGNTGQTYQNGDVIPGGFSGKKTKYNEGPEMVSPLTGFQPAKSNSPVAPEAGSTTLVTLDNWGRYLKLTDVTLSDFNGNAFKLTDANGTVAGYNQFYASVSLPSAAEAAEKTFDVEGIVSGRSGNPQFAPTKITVHGGGVIEIPEVANIAALLNMAQSTNAKITGAITAIYQNGQNLYVKDEAGTYALVFGSTGHTYENGDIIKGAVAYWKEYGAIKELVPSQTETWESTEQGDPVEPEEIALEEVSQQDVHKYFLIKNATITKDENEYTIVDESETPMVLYNKFNLTIPEELEGKTFDVKVFPTLYKAQDAETAVIQLYPIDIKDNSIPDHKVGDVNGDGEVGVADVTMLVGLLLDSTSNDYSDVNGDGETGVADLTALINILLEQ